MCALRMDGGVFMQHHSVLIAELLSWCLCCHRALSASFCHLTQAGLPASLSKRLQQDLRWRAVTGLCHCVPKVALLSCFCCHAARCFILTQAGLQAS